MRMTSVRMHFWRLSVAGVFGDTCQRFDWVVGVLLFEKLTAFILTIILETQNYLFRAYFGVLVDAWLSAFLAMWLPTVTVVALNLPSLTRISIPHSVSMIYPYQLHCTPLLLFPGPLIKVLYDWMVRQVCWLGSRLGCQLEKVPTQIVRCQQNVVDDMWSVDLLMTKNDNVEYVKDNAVPVVQSNVSSVPNDAYMMILNDLHEQPAQYASVTTQNNVVDKSLTAKLATYKEQVELYERRAKFELTEREQNIDEQLRIVITDRNIKEENLKRELHSLKQQLTSTINHNKSMVEEVTSLKMDFKQKENKYLEEFLDMKALKEKKKVAIGYKNPLCLTRAKHVQPALYNGHEIIKTNHVPAIVHNS
ncbi:hypothetical protein Tco_0676716 [Tanacetum coccineum]